MNEEHLNYQEPLLTNKSLSQFNDPRPPPSIESHLPPTNFVVNSLQLIREVYKQSLAIALQQQSHSNNQLLVSNNQILLNQFSWLLGEASTVPPLLSTHSIYIVRNEFNPHQFSIEFNSFNISIQSTAPTQWTDRSRKRFNVGDILLCALQLQTGLTKSQHIVDLGHVPFSILMRKLLASFLQDEKTSVNPAQIAAHPYDSSVLTPVQRIDSAKPIFIESNEMLEQLFKISSEEAATHGIVIGGITNENTRDFLHRIDSRYNLPPRQDFIPRSLLKSPSLTSPKSFSTSSPFSLPSAIPSSFLPTVDSLINAIKLDLVGLHTLLRVDRSIGSHIVELFDHHLQRQHQPGAKSRQPSGSRPKSDFQQNNKESKDLSVGTKNLSGSPDLSVKLIVSPSTMRSSLSSHRSHPYNRVNSTSTKLRPTLYETLTSRKLKPLIIVPSSMTSSLVHLENFKNFLLNREFKFSDQNRILGSNTTDSPYVGHDEYFTWTVDIPILKTRETSSNPSSLPQTNRISTSCVSMDFKVIGDSQVRKFTIGDWYRTIAVIVQGPEWQFKHWPFNNLESLFNCNRGIHFAFESDQLPQLIDRFPIDVLRLKRTTRHSDSTAWTQFVQTIETVLSTPRDFSLFDKSKLNAFGR